MTMKTNTNPAVTGRLVRGAQRAARGFAAPRPLRSGLRTEALEKLLDYRPLGFTAGLQQMARQASFRRAFADLG